MLCAERGVLSIRNANIVRQTNRQTEIYQRDELTTNVYIYCLRRRNNEFERIYEFLRSSITHPTIRQFDKIRCFRV